MNELRADLQRGQSTVAKCQAGDQIKWDRRKSETIGDARQHRESNHSRAQLEKNQRDVRSHRIASAPVYQNSPRLRASISRQLNKCAPGRGFPKEPLNNLCQWRNSCRIPENQNDTGAIE